MNRNDPAFKLWLALPRLVLVGIWFSFSLTLATPTYGQPEGSAVLRFERVGPASAEASVQVVLDPDRFTYRAAAITTELLTAGGN